MYTYIHMYALSIHKKQKKQTYTTSLVPFMAQHTLGAHKNTHSHNHPTQRARARFNNTHNIVLYNDSRKS